MFDGTEMIEAGLDEVVAVLVERESGIESNAEHCYSIRQRNGRVMYSDSGESSSIKPKKSLSSGEEYSGRLGWVD